MTVETIDLQLQGLTLGTVKLSGTIKTWTKVLSKILILPTQACLAARTYCPALLLTSLSLNVILLALCALVHPGSGSVSKGRGVGAPSETHCANRPSLQPWDETQDEELAAATRKNTVIVQHVKAIT